MGLTKLQHAPISVMVFAFRFVKATERVRIPHWEPNLIAVSYNGYYFGL